ncbi:kinase-like domain-containing protein [Syncephalis fuscata]|nr:kinase-like domain-containing protein [Syncephalis fuscata]
MNIKLYSQLALIATAFGFLSISFSSLQVDALKAEKQPLNKIQSDDTLDTWYSAVEFMQLDEQQRATNQPPPLPPRNTEQLRATNQPPPLPPRNSEQLRLANQPPPLPPRNSEQLRLANQPPPLPPRNNNLQQSITQLKTVRIPPPLPPRSKQQQQEVPNSSETSSLIGYGVPPLKEEAIDKRDAYGKKGLVMKKWIPTKPSLTAGYSEYKKEKAFLKCSSNKENFNKEDRAFADEFKAGRHYCLIISDAGDSNLYDYMLELTDDERRDQMPRLFRQLLYATAFLHSAKVAHNDIKPHNIMVNTKNKNNIIFSLIDYDLATELQFANGQVVRVASESGTIGFHPPEAFGKIPFDLRVADSWRLIATMYYFYGRESNYNPDHIIDPNSDTDPTVQYLSYMERVYQSGVNQQRMANLAPKTSAALQLMDKNSLKLFMINQAFRPAPAEYITKYFMKNYQIFNNYRLDEVEEQNKLKF